MIELKGRTVHKTVEPEVGKSILELALQHKIDWGFNCTRGTCARCRCFVSEGKDYLSPPNDAEYDRMDEEEIEEGYRLACQARIAAPGAVAVRLKTYF